MATARQLTHCPAIPLRLLRLLRPSAPRVHHQVLEAYAAVLVQTRRRRAEGPLEHLVCPHHVVPHPLHRLRLEVRLPPSLRLRLCQSLGLSLRMVEHVRLCLIVDKSRSRIEGGDGRVGGKQLRLLLL